MSTTSLLVLASAGVLFLTLAGRCRSEDHGSRRELADGCQQSGTLRASTTSHSCDECCKAGQAYPTYNCSPPVTGSRSTAKAIMTLNDFGAGGDGGDPSECDGKFHENSERVVALSTGWYADGKRCGKDIRINAEGGRSVLAKVVDQCDSLHGCDRTHAYQPPCRPNVVDASQAVWDALGITGDDVGEYPITWSDTPMLERSGNRLHALCHTVTTVSLAVLSCVLVV